MQNAIYIAGFERSGTTVLGNILATASGVENVGELEYLQKPTDRAGRECGCGRPIESCELWKRVVSDPSLDLARWHLLRKSTTRTRHIPKLIRRWRDDDKPPEYAVHLAQLYRCIGEGGRRAVVDSTKRLGAAFSAAVAPGVRTRVIHLVRDPRAVAFSRLSRAKRHGPTGEGATMVRHSVADTAKNWLLYNVSLEVTMRLSCSSDHYRILRYEDLMSEPKRECIKLATWLGLEPDSIAFQGHSTIDLRPTHTVRGNPNRFSSGVTDLVSDDQWKHELSARDRRIASTICSPLLRRHQYSYSAR